MLKQRYPLYLANRALQPNEDLVVHDKHSGAVATRVALADAAIIEAAIAAAAEATGGMRALPAYARQAALEHCVTRFRERKDELALALCVEAGKPIRDARGEVTRLIDTFRVAAEESVRTVGEALELEISPRTAGYRGLTKRVPIGACSFITPFNFPLNLVAHKIAPAIAAGCPFIVKPSERTPVGALILGEILAETELPPGAFSILPCRLEHAAPFSEDPRLALLSFTGSGKVGWALRAGAGRKKVVLELGGNAACIVDADQGGKLDAVAERLILGAFYQSGQSCISVQRILVHASLYADLRARLIASTSALVAGDPRDESTTIGPLIDVAAAERLSGWIARATARGARVLCGGGRRGAMLEATLLEGVPRDEPLYAEEAFGPVAILEPFSDFGAALASVNDSEFGLQAGVFSDSLEHAMRAWDELEVGGVIVGDVPSFRVDNMPYGGVKGSGVGREGVRYAIADMTEPRLLVLRGAAPSTLIETMSNAPSPHEGSMSRAHLPGLDGLRGLAIATVLVHNASILETSPDLGAKLWIALVGAGWVGVQLFFVLSGFLITGILLDDRGEPHAMRSFYVRRSLRIFPVYYGFLTLRFVLLPIVFGKTPPPLGLQIWSWLYLSNWSDFVVHHLEGMSHVWSLAVEEQFYLVWPLLVARTRARTFALVCVAVVVVSFVARVAIVFAHAPVEWSYSSTVTRADALALGALVALAVRSVAWRAWLARAITPIAVGCLVALAALVVVTRGLSRLAPLVQTAGYTLLAALFAAVVAAFALSTAPRWLAWLAHPALRLLGRYSYATYLFHVPVKELALRAYGPRLAVLAGAHPVATDVGFVALVAAASIALAALSYVVVERPALSLKDRWAPRSAGRS